LDRKEKFKEILNEISDWTIKEVKNLIEDEFELNISLVFQTLLKGYQKLR